MSDNDPNQDLDLVEALLMLKNAEEGQRFLADLCTPQELRALKERWRVCQLLAQGNLSYRDIHQITGASLTTIGRVARFLKEEQNQGYTTVLNRIKHGK
ncbi:MAG: DNA-binding transcriptional regulator [Burkholderiaceae bacterium]|nr:DNA-binding transcriptional regulator [Burkholderiaceae bacterium]